jgi:hypothetical protein
MISAAENSNNPKNQVLEGKISWEHGNTWRLTIQFKHDFLSYLAVQEIGTYIAKQCCVLLFCNGFTLGPTAEPTIVNMNHTII